MFRILARVLGEITGYNRMRAAEETWKSQNGEIPDGHCLVFHDGICETKKILE